MTQICTGQEMGDREVKVANASGSYYKYAWAGGMNSCQFGEIDLNLDGIQDIVAFDRTGDRILPLVNTGIIGEVSYEYAPEYVASFPHISAWMILADYDLDGKADIFTYSPGYAGMKVYHNISTSTLAFELTVFPFLTSFQGAGYTNILVTYADYPGIADIDGDGDLDILSFWGLGSFVELHQNLSVEKYGTTDSLDFEKVTTCWGYFAESEESNELTLDTCVGWDFYDGDDFLQQTENFNAGERFRLPHTGSTFLVLDLQGDQVMDVLLGDVDYPNLVALFNDGTRDSAHIASYDQYFPSYDKSIQLYSMPAAAYMDVNNDGARDLLVSPFDPNPFISENKFSSWLYLNNAGNEIPEFVFQQPDFLQAEMIDVGAGSYSCLADYDGDGLQDLFIGNYGYYDSSYFDEFYILHTHLTGKIALFQNIGTLNQPEFTYVSDDFAYISSLGLKGIVPDFADLDKDGDQDMLIGSENGRLYLFENQAENGFPMEMVLIDDFFAGIDVGDYSAPQFFDLDKDGVTDLTVGERDGNINYYKGFIGGAWMDFVLVTDSLGKVNVTDPDISLDGYSVPFFFQDDSGNTLLVVGSEQGEIFFYNHIDGNLEGEFTRSDTLGDLIGMPGISLDRGYRSSARIADIDHDGTFDLLAGNFSGGLEYFSIFYTPPVSQVAESGADHFVSLFPNPSREKITIQAEYPGEYRISGVQITDIHGIQYFSSTFGGENSITILINDFPSGIFICRVILQNRMQKEIRINKKLIIFN